MSQRQQDKQAGDLQKVLDVTRAMAATSDLDALLGLIIDRSMELLGAERATIFLYDAAKDELVSRVAAGVREIRTPASKGIAGATVRSRATLNVPDAYADERFNPEVDRQTGFRTRNILSVPLADYQGDLVGVLQVINKRGGAFGATDVALAETFAAQAGVAVQRAALIRHYIEKQNMERAMQIAREIQQGLLPRQRPRVEGFEVAGFSQPADQTGGDIYDFVPLPDGRCGLLVADATGHGIGPALIIAETRAMLRAACLRGADVSEALRTANRLLVDDLGQARFVTCFFGVLDGADASLRYASAGHGPILFYRRRDDAFEQAPATALPLGVMEDSPYDDVAERRFERGDLCLIVTDGFFEAADTGGGQFGLDRLMDLVRARRDDPPEVVIRRLHEAVAAFTGGQPQADDLTAIVVRRTA